MSFKFWCNLHLKSFFGKKIDKDFFDNAYFLIELCWYFLNIGKKILWRWVMLVRISDEICTRTEHKIKSHMDSCKVGKLINIWSSKLPLWAVNEIIKQGSKKPDNLSANLPPTYRPVWKIWNTNIATKNFSSWNTLQRRYLLL